MLIRHVKQSDVDEMYDLFRKSSVTLQDAVGKNPPKSGFYEYPLTFAEFKNRALSPLSLVCVNKGGVLSYILSYTVEEANKMLERGVVDPVLESIKGLDPKVVYHDQLLVQRGIPAHYFAARVLQTADRLAQNIGSPGVIGATPESPWKNFASTKLIAYQGFARNSSIDANGFTMGIYTKPFWPLNTPFESFGDNLVISKN